MILASAIKINYNNQTLILCGARHSDILKQLRILDLDKSKINFDTDIVQGFINQKNEFVTRQEAYNHAVQIGQLSAKLIHKYEYRQNKELISEDLW